MLQINPKDKSVQEIHKLLLGGVAPRPIALVSTLSQSGVPNLSPFSFFNAFGANPPVIAFSPARRGRDGSFKDTYLNLSATKECVVNAVTHSMVEQISLASAEYPPDVDEFVKSGLSPDQSVEVKPFRVKESPFQMECRLLNMISIGDKGASANIAICEVIMFHIAEDIFENGIISPFKTDFVARLGGDYYARIIPDSVFTVEKPLEKRGIGFDALPDFVKNSTILSANDLGKLANFQQLPDETTVLQQFESYNDLSDTGFEDSLEAFNRAENRGDYRYMYKFLRKRFDSELNITHFIERTAKIALAQSNVSFAWNTLMLQKFKNRVGK